ncbi:MAG TPA: carboxypeptidase-like regulatory domain-containing protein [Myxococcota bacterium]|nr:carboxypeptidase-like regulatory domain-containing protein [Myxococcota bacterium]
MRLFAAIAFLLGLAACQTHHAIMGHVIDRNGDPLDRVIITVDPGNVQLITDQSGYYEVDYLRDETGERVKMQKRTVYNVEAFKPGYHPVETTMEYKRGELLLEPLTLKEDTIRLVGTDQDIDPDEHPDRTHSSGGSYEGE